MKLTIEQALQQGVTAHNIGNLQEAERVYQSILRSDPKHPDANHNLGLIAISMNHIEEALPLFKTALEVNPMIEQFWVSYIEALVKADQLTDAKKAIKKAKKKGFDAKKLQVLLSQPKERTDINVPSEEQLTRLLKCYHDGKYDYTEQLALSIIEKFPKHHVAWKILSSVSKIAGRLDDSLVAGQYSVQLAPQDADAHFNLGNTLKDLGRLEEAVASYNSAIELQVDLADAYSNKNFSLNYLSSGSPSFIFEQHLAFGKNFGGLQNKSLSGLRSDVGTGNRLRVGYVSGDFRKHSVAYFFEPLLQHHNSNLVETFCYYNNAPIDEITKRLMATSDHWRSIVGVTDSDAANLIKNDKIDILVDLSGHTAKNRLLVFARKPAPIQVTWLGYANTTGLSEIDYRFTDLIADPIGEADELHSETLVRLANGFQCYKGNEAVHSNNELPFKRQGHITLGSFNALIKLTPEVIKVWSNILHALPKSCLVLKAKQLQHHASYYTECFKQEGIAEDRIKLYGLLPSMEDHLELYNAIDIGLDPFPFNGATTTCEALWMGVPVITLLGDRHAGRVGASILTNVGLTDFIAQDIDGYIQLVVEMAAKTNYLQEIRKGLRERMQRAPLCDGRSFASDVESAYQEMCHHYQK